MKMTFSRMISQILIVNYTCWTSLILVPLFLESKMPICKKRSTKKVVFCNFLKPTFHSIVNNFEGFDNFNHILEIVVTLVKNIKKFKIRIHPTLTSRIRPTARKIFSRSNTLDFFESLGSDNLDALLNLSPFKFIM